MRCSILLLALAAFATWDAPRAGATSLLQPADDLESLRQKLLTGDARARRVAVGDLADLGSGEAWELVMGGLADPEPEVADQAQLEVARISDPEVVEALLGRAGLGSKDALVRARVAEALGRCERTVEPEALLDAVGDREAEVRRLGWWAVERLAIAGRIGAEDREDLVRAATKAARGERAHDVRGAALIALAVLEPREAREVALDALRPRSATPVRCAAAMALAAAVDDDASAAAAVEVMGQAALDEDASLPLRMAVLGALARVGRRSGLEAMVDLLEVDGGLRLELATVGRLRALTGGGYGRNPRGWRALIADLPEDWRPRAEESAAGRSEEDTEGTSASLAGLPILSDRVAVLIDMSGSMWQTRGDGRTLKQLVERELELFLGKLPEGARFNIVPYGTTRSPVSGVPPEVDIVPFDDELVAATPRNLAAGLEWFVGNRTNGRGPVWEAIEVALADEGVDTLVILTDGAPSGGVHWNLGLIVDLLLERNRFRQVAFDLLLIEPKGSFEAGGFLRRQWERLTEASAGACVEARFSDG
jgi:hypothetical protein